MAVKDLQIVIRACERGPNYLSSTIAGLHGQEIPKDRIHVFPTAPKTGWIDHLTRGRCTVHEPSRVFKATENMGIALCGAPACEWVMHLEDDVRLCQDFLGSVSRWLDRYARTETRLYSFFTPSIRRQMLSAFPSVSCLPFTLDRWQSSVCVVLRYDDAQACGRWILDHADTWRTGQGEPSWKNKRGADKMIAAWQAVAYPQCDLALSSVPCLVEHVGRVSTLKHLGRFAFVQAPIFTGQAWRAS